MQLSIITINYNNAPGLKKTFESVFCQTYVEFEYIVIDGGSSDGSRELINKYVDKITYWQSEKDDGVYNAMNKGIQHANGAYLLFLNSGDCFYKEDVLQKALDTGFSQSIVYCDIKNNLTGEIIKFPDQLRFSHFYHATINHQSTFIAKKLFDENGHYNEDYEIASDWAFFIKCIFLRLEPTRHLDLTLVEFDFTDGISTRPPNFNKMIQERKEILEKFFPGFVNDYEEVDKLKRQIQVRSESSLNINKSIVSFLRLIRNLIRTK